MTTGKTHSYICYLILLVLAFTWNAYMCTMSPLREVVFSPDANCFYMAGKCMALGYVPYVDFVDTKGPLLFVVYMLGYLLSPDKTLGVYIIASLATFITFILLFKIGKLYNLKNQQAILAVLFCSLFLFYRPIYGYGGRAEQFMLPVIVWIMYTATKIAIPSDTILQNWKHFAISVGSGAGIILFCKFNYIVYPVGTLLLSSLLIYKNQEAKEVCKLIAKYVFLSFLIITIPIVIYLVCVHAFDAFIQVYFKLSASNALPGKEQGIMAKIEQIENLYLSWMRRDETLWVFGSILLLFSSFYSKKTVRNAPLFLFLSSVTLILGSYLGLYRYYSLMILPLLIFFTITLISKFRLNGASTAIITLLVMIWGVDSNYKRPNEAYLKKVQQIKEPGLCKDFSKIEKIIASKKRAKILYIDFLGTGFSIRTGALPACPNWFYLNKADKSTLESAYAAIEQGKADFVISRSNYRDKWRLEQSGYKVTAKFLEGEYCRGAMLLWSKEDIKI